MRKRTLSCLAGILLSVGLNGPLNAEPSGSFKAPAGQKLEKEWPKPDQWKSEEREEEPLEPAPEDSPGSHFDLGFSLEHFDEPGDYGRGFERDKLRPTSAEVNRVKLSIDNAISISLHYAGREAGLEDSVGGRIGILGLNILGMALTAHWAHEVGGHAATYRPPLDDAVHKINGRINPNFFWTRTYSMLADSKSGGLNNSEDLFNMYNQDGILEGMTLTNSLGHVTSKLDAFIQWTYSFGGREGLPKDKVYYEIGKRIRSGRWKMDQPSHKKFQDQLGKGDIRAYLEIIGLKYDADPRKDLLASVISTALSAHVWQGLIMPFKYIANGKRSEKAWHLTLGQTEVYWPSFKVYRLATGYYGEGKMFMKLGKDLPFLSVEGGTGLNSIGGDVQKSKFGAGIHKLEAIPGLLLSGTAYAVMNDESAISGFGVGGKIEYMITNTCGVYAQINFDRNPITLRPGTPEKRALFTGGLRILLGD